MPFALKTRQTIHKRLRDGQASKSHTKAVKSSYSTVSCLGQAARISGRFGCGVALWQEAAEPEPLRMLKELDLPMPFSGQCKPRPTHRSTLTDSVSMSQYCLRSTCPFTLGFVALSSNASTRSGSQVRVRHPACPDPSRTL